MFFTFCIKSIMIRIVKNVRIFRIIYANCIILYALITDSNSIVLNLT